MKEDNPKKPEWISILDELVMNSKKRKIKTKNGEVYVNSPEQD